MTRLREIFGVLLLFALTAHAEKMPSVDAGECGGETPKFLSLMRTPAMIAMSGSRMYGVIELRRNQQDVKQKSCRIVYRLLVAAKGTRFREIYRHAFHAQEGMIPGIDLIGFSPDESKAAANFWWAEGDGQINSVVLFDFKTKRVTYREMPLIEDIRPGRATCDYDAAEKIESVTDSGAVLVGVETSSCGDGGRWSFSVRTGKLSLLSSNSSAKQ